jgi:NADPH-dependent curcumin reductase CurA
VPTLTNRQIVLRRRPHGLVAPEDTELVTAPAPEPGDGEALVRTTYVGIDAAARTWLDDQPGYLPPVGLGEVIRAAGIGEVVQSRCAAYSVGDIVTTLTGFQEYTIVRDDLFTTPVPGPGDQVDQLAVMSIYGPTGATAYFGMTGIGRPQPGETVVVSAAAGATGSVAGQIAKIAGARVVGIAGGPHKCRAVWRTSVSTRASTTATRTCLRRCGSTARRAWTSISTTSAGRSSMRCSAGSRTRRASCCAG